MGILVLKYVRIPHFALNWNQKTHSEDFCSLLCAFTTAYFPLEQERQAIKLESVSSSCSKDLCYFSKIPITYWCINDTKTWMLPGATVLHYKGSSLLFQRCTKVKHQWLFLRGKYFDPLFCHSASSTCSVLQTLTFTTENNVPASLNRKPPLFLSLAQQKVSPCTWERGTNHGAFLIPHSTQSETQLRWTA